MKFKFMYDNFCKIFSLSLVIMIVFCSFIFAGTNNSGIYIDDRFECLDGLDDVNVSSQIGGEILRYDATTNKWNSEFLIGDGNDDKLAKFNSIGDIEPFGTVGSENEPIYIKNDGTLDVSKYAGGTSVSLNGSDKSSNTAEFYAPTTSGSDGEYLKINNSGNLEWENLVKTMYPVGSVFITTDPNKLPSATGVTWQKLSTDNIGLITASFVRSPEETYEAIYTPSGSWTGIQNVSLTTNHFPNHNHHLKTSFSTDSKAGHSHGVGTYEIIGQIGSICVTSYFNSGAFYKREKDDDAELAGNDHNRGKFMLNANSTNGFTGNSANYKHSHTVNFSGNTDSSCGNSSGGVDGHTHTGNVNPDSDFYTVPQPSSVKVAMYRRIS